MYNWPISMWKRGQQQTGVDEDVDKLELYTVGGMYW